MTAELPPFAVFFTGALLVALAPVRLQKVLLLLTPVVAGLLLLGMPGDDMMVMTAIGYELIPHRVDRLSLLFSYIFTLAAFISIVFS